MPASQVRVNGSIDNLYDTDTGAVTEDGTTSKYDFFHPGAQVEFVKGDLVNYLKITTPTGKVIVNDIKKK